MVATKALDNIVNAAEDQTTLEGLIDTFRTKVAELDAQLHFSELMVTSFEWAKGNKYRTATSTAEESAKSILQSFVRQTQDIVDKKAAVVQAYTDIQAKAGEVGFRERREINKISSEFDLGTAEERSAKIMDDFEKYQEEDYQATVDRFEQLGKRYRQEFNVSDGEEQKTKFQVKRWMTNFNDWIESNEDCSNKLKCMMEESELNKLIRSARDDVVQAKVDMIRLQMERNGELPDYKQIRARKFKKVINAAKEDTAGNGFARNNLYTWSVECGVYETFKNEEDLTAESGFDESNLEWYNRFAPKSNALQPENLCERIQSAFDDIHSVL